MHGIHGSLALSVTLASLCTARVPVYISTGGHIGPTDSTIQGVPLADAEITVHGCQLTINGRHTIASLRVEPRSDGTGGVVTHDPTFQYQYDRGDLVRGLHLTVRGDVTIVPGGALKASARGYAPGHGPGVGDCSSGASYGGRGSRGPLPCSDADTAPPYGDRWRPEDFGSGGGGIASDDIYGGGCLRLWISGTLWLNGTTAASAGPLDIQGGSGNGPAGAAGGSVWIRAGRIEVGSSGAVHAGGFYGQGMNGGGGGGRVALFVAEPGSGVNVYVGGGGSGFIESGTPRGFGASGTVVSGSGLIDIAMQPPRYTLVLAGRTITLSVSAATRAMPETLTYQWRRRAERGTYVPIADGDLGGRISGANSPALIISDSDCSDSGHYDCLIGDVTGLFPSESAELEVRSPADVDDGSGSGNPDGGLTVDDLLYYLFAFEAGDILADVDDGSSTGTLDGGVTIDDLLYYLARFEAGC